MGQKHTVTVHGAPCGWKAYIKRGEAWLTRGSFTTLLSLSQCHAAFSTIPSTLAWVNQSPVSVCCSNPQQGIPSTPVTASHVTQGMNPHNSEVHTKGWIYGRHQTNTIIHIPSHWTFVFCIQFLQNSIQYTINNFPNTTWAKFNS